jgi:hypothetical protein
MTSAEKTVEAVQNDWLGRPQTLTAPKTATEATWLIQAPEMGHVRPLRSLVSGRGDKAAKLKSQIRLGWTTDALYLHAVLFTSNMDRVLKLAGEPEAHRRDQWGADALEMQIDMGRTQKRYAHLIFTPCGQMVSYEGFNNRHVDGYHPEVGLAVTINQAQGTWVIQARIGFAALGATPRPGDVWGLNLLRVDADEEGGYAQWAPTYGDALRPTMFGGLKFLAPKEQGTRDDASDQGEIDAFGAYWRATRAEFQHRINAVTDQEALGQLLTGPDGKTATSDWKAWAGHLAGRAHPGAVRWESLEPGVVPEQDRKTALALAAKMMEKIQGWDPAQPTVEALEMTKLESLADALILTGEATYAKAIEKAILTHDACWRALLEKPGTPVGHEHPRLYPDFQVIQALFLGYAYLALCRHGKVDEKVHGAVMTRMLRAGRFADHNISLVYNYGNHQIFESAGLAVVAALFPEFAESDRWAQTASLAMRKHYLSDVYADGGYMERCGYHTVALSFTAQAIAVIKASGQENRFAAFMCDEVMEVIDRMYGWVVKMTLPDATLPAFGDFRKHPQGRLLTQGAALRGRPEWLAPLNGTALGSMSLDESAFTVMRSATGGHAMAVDHGPMGGQHSHIDTLGFVAYAGGQAVAVDSGMGLSYSDPNYMGWYRNAEAHNMVTVDDAVPEKLARRTGWHAGAVGDILVMRSDAWLHTRGLTWERAILFSHLGAWAVFDRLWRVNEQKAKPGVFDLHLHSPVALKPGPEGWAWGDDVVLAVAGSGSVTGPVIRPRPGTAAPPETMSMRLHDAMTLYGHAVVEDVSHATWRVKAGANGGAWFTTVILPTKASGNAVELVGERSAIVRIGDARVVFAREENGWVISQERGTGGGKVERLAL